MLFLTEIIGCQGNLLGILPNVQGTLETLRLWLIVRGGLDLPIQELVHGLEMLLGRLDGGWVASLFHAQAQSRCHRPSILGGAPFLLGARLEGALELSERRFQARERFRIRAAGQEQLLTTKKRI